MSLLNHQLFPCRNIILCWLPAWAEIWNCHPQTCKSDSTSLIRKVKLNIHSQAAFQVQTVWSSLRQNVFKLKHIFSSFLCSKNSECVSRWKNHKIMNYFACSTEGGLGFPSFWDPHYCFWPTPFISFVRKPTCVCMWLLFIIWCFLYVSCSGINQVVKHLRFQWKHIDVVSPRNGILPTDNFIV